jgi:hypothetical protein
VNAKLHGRSDQRGGFFGGGLCGHAGIASEEADHRRDLQSGGRQSGGVANALLEARLPKRPLYIAHEVNAETERLIRQRQIDYLLTQDLDQMVLQLGEVVLESKAAGRLTNLTRLLPIRVFTPFHFL